MQVSAFILLCLLLALQGCLGGGGTSGGHVTKSNATVSGYAFVPEGSLGKAAQKGKLQPMAISAPAGMVPLENAVVRLSDSSASGTTDSTGYYVMNVLISQDTTKTVEILHNDTVMVSYSAEIKPDKVTLSSAEIAGTTGNWSLQQVVSKVADDLVTAVNEVEEVIDEDLVFSDLTSATDKGTGGAAQLAWTAATHSDIPITYNIFVATTSEGQDFEAAPYATTQTTTGTTVSGLTDDTTYYIVVRAVTSGGKKEYNTTEQSVTVTTSTATLSGSVTPSGAIVQLWDTSGKATDNMVAEDEDTSDDAYLFSQDIGAGTYILRAYYRISESYGYYYEEQIELSPGSNTFALDVPQIEIDVENSDDLCQFYGEVEWDTSVPVRVGDYIIAKDPDGIACGLFIVGTEGEYGLIVVYGDDSSTLDVDEGAEAGETISFFVNGQGVSVSTTPTFQDGVSSNVDLSVSGN